MPVIPSDQRLCGKCLHFLKVFQNWQGLVFGHCDKDPRSRTVVKSSDPGCQAWEALQSLVQRRENTYTVLRRFGLDKVHKKGRGFGGKRLIDQEERPHGSGSD